MTRTLQVHRSHRGEDLVASLAAVLAQSTGDPLAADAVVVHSKGLERWLAMQLADRNGICANVWFCFPQDLLGAAFSAALGDDADASQWSRGRIAWAILAALPELDAVPALQPVRDFIAAGEGLDDDRRRVDIAQQIAALFERYATYRPELVRSWAAGEGVGWEPALWRAVAARIHGHDLAELTASLEAALAGDDLAFLDTLPRRICVFSVSTLPPLTVRLLARLAAHVEVHLFLLTPSETWWQGLRGIAETLTGEGMPAPTSLPDLPTHPLLESMGTLARDFQLSVLRVSHADVSPSPDDPRLTPDSALLHLQADLREGRLPDEPHALDASDRSIQVHACHGPTRQVQVLRDVLIATFDENPDLEPRDVLVMAPEIEAYAPLVRAVFDDGAESWKKRGGHAGGLPRLPFRLADRGVSSSNPAADALLSILRLAGGRLKATEVLDVLARDPVRRRFCIASDDLPQVRQWAVGAGIRWAADADHRSDVGQPASELYTWRHGLDRLMAGQAVSDPEDLLLGVLPFGDVEGRDARAVLGGFVDFSEKITRWTAALASPRTIDQWRDALLRLLDDFVALEYGSGWQLEQVREGLAELGEEASDAGFVGALDRGAVESLLQGRFAIGEPGAGFLSGGITFCQLVPMRSIPFRVVCLLGMDDGAFPRSSGGLAFDLIESSPRVGDRSIREDDRGLFLEAILAARDRLVITYSGRGVRNDRPRPAAVPVAELLDAIDQSFAREDGERPSGGITLQHPLQPFSPRNFSVRAGAGYPFGLDARQREAARAWRRGRAAAGAGQPTDLFLVDPLYTEPTDAPDPAGPAEPLELGRLCRFFKDPLDSFCKTRLGLWTPDREDPTEDREPLDAPKGLVAWTLRDQLLKDALDGADLQRHEDAWQRLRQRPGLPLGMPGDVAYDALVDEALEIAERVFALRPGAAWDPVDVELEIAGRTLVGRVDDLYECCRVEYRAGSMRAEHVVQGWVRHLALHASGWSGDTWLLGRRAARGLAPVDAEDALEHLADLVRLYEVGQQTPLLFFPEPSRGWVVAELWEGDEEEGDPPEVPWPPSAYSCPWRERFLGDADPFAPGFASPALAPVPALTASALAERVWGPALSHVKEVPS